MSVNIPIKNIYHLLAYAWDVLPRKSTCNVSAIENMNFQNKLIYIFLEQVRDLVKSGLGKRYEETEEESSSIKGKIQWSKSAILMERKSKVSCIYDEFTFKSNNKGNLDLPKKDQRH